MKLPEKTEIEARVAGILKAELKRAGVTYTELCERLAASGIDEKPANIGNKLSRGKFSAVFLVQCMDAIGVSDLRL